LGATDEDTEGFDTEAFRQLLVDTLHASGVSWELDGDLSFRASIGSVQATPAPPGDSTSRDPHAPLLLPS
jgi:hypothetical protein